MSQGIVKGDLKNPQKLDKELLDFLLFYFKSFCEAEKELGTDALRYIVDNEGNEGSLFQRLTDSKAALNELGYNNLEYNATALGLRGNVFQANDNAPPDYWIRLCKVLLAASTPTAQRMGVTRQKIKGWPDWLSLLISEITSASVYGKQAKQKKWSFEHLSKILAYEDLPDDLFMDALLNQNNQYLLKTGYYYGNNQPENISGMSDYLEKHWQIVQQVLNDADAERRVFVLNFLARTKFSFSRMPQLLAQMATGSSKTVREAAFPVLQQNKAACRSYLEDILSNGGASERAETAVLLFRTYGEEAVEELKKQLEKEKSEKIKQTIQKLLSATEEHEQNRNDAETIELPPVEIELGDQKVPEQLKSKLRDLLERGHLAREKQYEQQKAQYDSPDRPKWMNKPVKPQLAVEDALTKIISFVETGDPKFELDHEIYTTVHMAGGSSTLLCDGLKLIHVVRLSYALWNLQIQNNRDGVNWYDQRLLESYRASLASPFGLRELDLAVASLPKASKGIIADTYLQRSKWNSVFDWESEAIWPLFAENLKVLREVFNPTTKETTGYYSYYDSYKRANAFKILAMFPKLPAEYKYMLWELALGEAKAERPAAQKALHTVQDKCTKIIASLQDGKQGVRQAAAEWLGKLGDKGAIEALKKAFKSEKNELVKGTIMLALDNLGANVDEFLDRDNLEKESKQGLAKKLPKGMEWVPLASLPKLHWQDNGKQVDPNIVKWWVVQSIQQKSPSPSPVLKRFLSMCRPADASALANHILQLWIARDTATASAEDCAAKAQADADKNWGYYSQHQYYLDMYKGSKDNLYQQLYQTYSNTCIYSAIEQKGMLAIVAAAGDGNCVKISEQYIRKWFGNRLAQCKALIEVLSDIDHPLALQALLAFANRFRTKAIKQLAEERVKAVAEARGWTIDELADRTIPDAGFARPEDENGEPIGDQAVLELDFGPRQFQLKLNDDLEPVIMAKGETKILKALPAPGKNDDPELAKAAKKEFSDAKKVVKEVVKRQSERLYEAMCTQRSWKFGDFKRYLAQHPIVGRLCVGLVWAAYKPETKQEQLNQTHSQKPALARENLIGCFRPLEDGSLTNESDDEVRLDENTVVTVAHRAFLDQELADAWIKHLKDYDVIPLFSQLGRAGYQLPEKDEKATEITDFQGHMTTTFKLRGKATKLGYLRGEAEDGGCFYIYRKPFSSLSIQAVIEFTGSYLPEEDLPAALTTLYFTAMQQENTAYWQPNKMQLAAVPPVLLSECYNDIKQIAAEGSGYDPKWKEKGLF